MSALSQHPMVLITEGSAPAPLAWLRRQAEVVEIASDSPDFVAGLSRADALVVRTYTRVDTALLERAPSLKVVGRGGVGLENIDVAACRRRGVEVVYTPEANTQAVVEFVIGIALRLIRPWNENASELMSPNKFKAMRETAGEEISALTLGVLGMGRVGRAVARAAARGFGMRVLYNDLVDVAKYLDSPAQAVSFERLLGECDVLSLHVDARPSNRGLIDAAALTQGHFRWLINTSRGMVIDAAALAPALRTGPLLGVALDVYDPEPPGPDSAYARLLAEFPGRVILTPHMASRTHRALENMSWVVRDVMHVLEGRPPGSPAP